jgi:hypothetical protein
MCWHRVAPTPQTATLGLVFGAHSTASASGIAKSLADATELGRVKAEEAELLRHASQEVGQQTEACRFPEHDTTRNDLLVCLWVPKPPSLIVFWIADKGTLSCMRQESRALVLLQVDICENSQKGVVGEIGLTTLERFERGKGVVADTEPVCCSTLLPGARNQTGTVW